MAKRRTRKAAKKRAPAKRRSRGRRSKLTPEVQERICAVIAYGGYDKDAAAAVDIRPETLCEWMRKGEEGGEGREAYTQFAQEVYRARLRRPDAIMRKLAEHPTNPKAWEAYLKRLDTQAQRREEREKRGELMHRQLEAKVRQEEAKAAALEKVAAGGQAGVMLLPHDLLEELLDDLPENLRLIVMAELRRRGLGLVEEPDLGGGVTEDDVRDVSPSEGA